MTNLYSLRERPSLWAARDRLYCSVHRSSRPITMPTFHNTWTPSCLDTVAGFCCLIGVHFASFLCKLWEKYLYSVHCVQWDPMLQHVPPCMCLNLQAWDKGTPPPPLPILFNSYINIRDDKKTSKDGTWVEGPSHARLSPKLYWKKFSIRGLYKCTVCMWRILPYTVQIIYEQKS